MKRFAALILSVIFIISLVSCGDTGKKKDDSTDDHKSDAEETPLVMIRSAGRLAEPYWNFVWSQSYSGGKEMAADGMGIDFCFNDVKNEIPKMIYGEDFEIVCDEKVKLGEISLRNGYFAEINDSIALKDLKLLSDGLYYLVFRAVVQGEYVEAKSKYNTSGYECVCKLIIGEDVYTDEDFFVPPIETETETETEFKLTKGMLSDFFDIGEYDGIAFDILDFYSMKESDTEISGQTLLDDKEVYIYKNSRDGKTVEATYDKISLERAEELLYYGFVYGSIYNVPWGVDFTKIIDFHNYEAVELVYRDGYIDSVKYSIPFYVFYQEVSKLGGGWGRYGDCEYLYATSYVPAFEVPDILDVFRSKKDELSAPIIMSYRYPYTDIRKSETEENIYYAYDKDGDIVRINYIGKKEVENLVEGSEYQLSPCGFREFAGEGGDSSSPKFTYEIDVNIIQIKENKK